MDPVERWIQEERAREAEERRRKVEELRDARRWEEERRWSDRVWAAEHEVGAAVERAKDASRDVIWVGIGLVFGLIANEVWEPQNVLTTEQTIIMVAATMLFLGGRATLRNREANDAQAKLTRIIAGRPRA